MFEDDSKITVTVPLDHFRGWRVEHGDRMVVEGKITDGRYLGDGTFVVEQVEVTSVTLEHDLALMQQKLREEEEIRDYDRRRQGDGEPRESAHHAGY